MVRSNYQVVLLSGAALSDEANEVDLIRTTKLHKKKRKKNLKSVQAEEIDEVDERKVTLSDTEEQMKQLKLSERASLKSGSKSSKRKKKRGSDKSSPLKDLCNAMANSDGEKMEESIPVKKKGHQKKRHHQSDEPTSIDDNHLEQATLLSDDDQVRRLDGDDSDQSDQESDVHVSQSDGLPEGQDTSQEDMADTNEAALSLMPLGHGGTIAKEKKTVQRQLPQWITEADIIQDDIVEQSR